MKLLYEQYDLLNFYPRKELCLKNIWKNILKVK